MTGKFIPQTRNPHVFSHAAIDKANFPMYGEGGAIDKLDNAYFRTQVGNLVIIGMAFNLNIALAASTPIMGFNTYTGTTNSNVYGTLTDGTGASTSVYLGYQDGVPQIYCSSAMASGSWRGVIMFTVDA